MHKDKSGKEELEEPKKKVEGADAGATPDVKSDAEPIAPEEKQRIIDDVVARIAAMGDEELQAMVAGMESDGEESEDEVEEAKKKAQAEDEEGEEPKEDVEEAKKVKSACSVGEKAQDLIGDTKEVEDVEEAKKKAQAEDEEIEDEVEEAKKKAQAEDEEDEVEEEEEDYDMAEDVAALISGESNLTEAFKNKAKVIFESAVKAKFKKERVRLSEKYEERAKSERSSIKAELTEQVDSYLNYVVENWMKENKLAVQAGLRTEAAEKFISSLKSVFAENYIELPAGKTTVLEELNGKLADLTEKLAASKVDLNQSLSITQSLRRKAILAEASKGLASTEAERLVALTKDSKFESTEAFKAKVAIIKESYFRNKSSSAVKPTVSGKTTTHVIVEDAESEILSDDMKRYISAISQVEANNPNAMA